MGFLNHQQYQGRRNHSKNLLEYQGRSGSLNRHKHPLEINCSKIYKWTVDNTTLPNIIHIWFCISVSIHFFHHIPAMSFHCVFISVRHIIYRSSRAKFWVDSPKLVRPPETRLTKCRPKTTTEIGRSRNLKLRFFRVRWVGFF